MIVQDFDFYQQSEKISSFAVHLKITFDFIRRCQVGFVFIFIDFKHFVFAQNLLNLCFLKMVFSKEH